MSPRACVPGRQAAGRQACRQTGLCKTADLRLQELVEVGREVDLEVLDHLALLVDEDLVRDVRDPVVRRRAPAPMHRAARQALLFSVLLGVLQRLHVAEDEVHLPLVLGVSCQLVDLLRSGPARGSEVLVEVDQRGQRRLLHQSPQRLGPLLLKLEFHVRSLLPHKCGGGLARLRLLNLCRDDVGDDRGHSRKPTDDTLELLGKDVA
mmetsp:Transcript_79160/g.246513  ORF Transcript_79160/g.246513 Transcript_79160/m.246513 type:complete len:207 (-) Transcript_79160:185-805(-)